MEETELDLSGQDLSKYLTPGDAVLIASDISASKALFNLFSKIDLFASVKYRPLFPTLF